MPSHTGICLRTSQFRRGRASRPHPGTTTETVRSDLFRLSSTGVRLRPVSHAATVRVHRLLGLSGFSGVLHATGQLQAMRGGGRRSAVGHGETQLDQGSHAFPGALGAQTLLEGNRRRVPHLLGQGSRCGGLSGFLGAGASCSGGDSSYWGGRDSVRQGAQISDLGLPDRPGLHAVAMDWQGTDRENLQGILCHDRPGGVGEDRVRLLGHVETVFGCDSGKVFPGPQHP